VAREKAKSKNGCKYVQPIELFHFCSTIISFQFYALTSFGKKHLEEEDERNQEKISSHLRSQYEEGIWSIKSTRRVS